MALPAELENELETLVEGEPVGIVIRDPNDGRHFLKSISLKPSEGKEPAILYLEWITCEAKIRTVMFT